MTNDLRQTTQDRFAGWTGNKSGDRVEYGWIPSLLDDQRMRLHFINVPTEHALFLKLFVTNGGGW